MTDIYRDFVFTRNTTPIAADDTTITVEDVSTLPDSTLLATGEFWLTIEAPLSYPPSFEIIQLLSVDVTTKTLTVNRGTSGTIAVDHPIAAWLKGSLTSEMLYHARTGMVGTSLPDVDWSVYRPGDRFWNTSLRQAYILDDTGWITQGGGTGGGGATGAVNSSIRLYALSSNVVLRNNITHDYVSNDSLPAGQYRVYFPNSGQYIRQTGNDFVVDQDDGGWSPTPYVTIESQPGPNLLQASFEVVVTGLAKGDVATVTAYASSGAEVPCISSGIQPDDSGAFQLAGVAAAEYNTGGEILPWFTLYLYTDSTDVQVAAAVWAIRMLAGSPQTPPNAMNPAAIMGLTAEPGGTNEITISWDTVSDAFDYLVTLTNDSDPADLHQQWCTDPTYTFTGTDSGISYTIAVYARNGWGVGTDSPTVTAVTG